MSYEDEKGRRHETVELGTYALSELWTSSSNLMFQICIGVGAVLGGLAGFLLRHSVPYWFTVGILGGILVGTLAGALLQGFVAFIREVFHPTANPGRMRCIVCKRKVLVPLEWLGKNVKCPHCGIEFLAVPPETAKPTKT